MSGKLGILVSTGVGGVFTIAGMDERCTVLEGNVSTECVGETEADIG